MIRPKLNHRHLNETSMIRKGKKERKWAVYKDRIVTNIVLLYYELMVDSSSFIASTIPNMGRSRSLAKELRRDQL